MQTQGKTRLVRVQRGATAYVVIATMALALAGCGDDTAGAADDTASGTGGTETSAEGSGGNSTEPTGTDADSSGGDSDAEPPEVETELLTPVEHLIRISMALRGTRPSLEDIAAVRDEPERVAEFVDDYMSGPGFGEMLRDLHNDAMLTGVEDALPAYPPLEHLRPQYIADSVMDTATRLAQHVVEEDRPYTELVTADYWMVNDTVAAVYGIDDGGSGWREASIPSSRPAAGVLSDNAFFLRHGSAGANFHRGRANAVTTAFLCLDFQDNNIEIEEGVDLTDPEAVATAVTTKPACVACHDSLDPLASHFFTIPGNVMSNALTEYPVPDLFRPTDANDWQDTTGRAPGYFGEPSDDLGDLGAAIAADPRFSACTARRFYAYFLQRRWEEVDADTVDAFESVLNENEMSAKALIRAIVLSEDFQVAGTTSEDGADDVHGYLRARPFQMARMFEDLTGFRWQLDPLHIDPAAGEGVISLPRSSTVGFEVLAGGTDSLSVTAPVRTVNATTSLFQRQLAVEAASFVVASDVDPGTRRLLDPGLTGEAEVREQLAALFLRLYGQAVETDGDDVGDAWVLFEAVLAQSGDSQRAWTATLAAMLRDLHIIFY